MATLLNDKMGITIDYNDLLIIENSLKKKIKIKINSLKRNLKKEFKPNDGCVDVTKCSIQKHGSLFKKVIQIRTAEEDVLKKRKSKDYLLKNWNEYDSDIFIYHLINEYFFTMIDSTLDVYLTKTRKEIEEK